MTSRRSSSFTLLPGQRKLGSFFSKPPASATEGSDRKRAQLQDREDRPDTGTLKPAVHRSEENSRGARGLKNEVSLNTGDERGFTGSSSQFAGKRGGFVSASSLLAGAGSGFCSTDPKEGHGRPRTAATAGNQALERKGSINSLDASGALVDFSGSEKRGGFRTASSLLRDMDSGSVRQTLPYTTHEKEAGASKMNADGSINDGPSDELREQWRRKKEERLRKLEKQKADRHKSVQSSIESCLKRRKVNDTASQASSPLPDECWRIIFAYLPRQQMRSLRGCCRSWRDVIDAADFMPHSKRYDALLSSSCSASPADSHGRSNVLAVDLRPEERWFLSNGVVTVSGMMAALQKGLFRTQPSSLLASLRAVATESEEGGQSALLWSGVLNTLEILEKKVKGNHWCLALLGLLFVCEKELLPSVIRVLLSGGAGASRADVVEFLHLLLAVPRTATWISEPLPVLRHIDAALQYHLLAEEVACRERNVLFHLSAEQHDIIDTDLKPEQVMVVTAFAGTGKTTTLVEYTRRRPGKSFAYLVFNRSVMLEAEQKFCKNTKCVNFHRLAYAKVGWLYKHKLTGSQPAPHIVARALGIRGGPDALFALKTLDAYLQSADDEISEDHVPPAARRTSGRSGADMASRGAEIVDLAKRLWEKMRDKQSTEVFMTHGGYLKMYQLTRPRLDYQYDVVMLDEAQDASPVMADIVLRQTGCSKIIVGDPHQQIYGFMGAINVMKTVREEGKGVVERQLTRSFRFGSEIASVCNSLLHVKGEKSSVIGARASSTLRAAARIGGAEAGPRHAAVSSRGPLRLDDIAGMAPRGSAPASSSTLQGRRAPLTFVARANATLFEAAAGTRAKALGFVGGLRDYRFDLLLDTWYLMKGELGRIKDGYLKTFKSWQELEEMVRHTDDVELRSRINIVKRNYADLDEKIGSIEKRDVGSDLSKALVTFTTAHKAKGLEFDTVVLAEDFVSFCQLAKDGDKFLMAVDSFSDEAEYEEVQVDEINLVYVAASRAKKRLLLNADLSNLLHAEASGERNPRLLVRATADASFARVLCTQCKQKCTGDLLVVCQKRQSDDDGGGRGGEASGVREESARERWDDLVATSSSAPTTSPWQVHVCEACVKLRERGVGGVPCGGSATLASVLHVFET